VYREKINLNRINKLEIMEAHLESIEKSRKNSETTLSVETLSVTEADVPVGKDSSILVDLIKAEDNTSNNKVNIHFQGF